MQLPGAFLDPSSKNEKNPPRKKFLIFQKSKLFSSNIKEFQETEAPKKIPYISGNQNPRKAFYISENRVFQFVPRKFVILQKTKIPKKLLILSQKKAFLIFLETEIPKKLFIFQEAETLKNFLYYKM